MAKNTFISPYIAGIGIGLTLLLTIVLTGWGLGASTPFALLPAVGINSVSPDFADDLDYFARYLEKDSPLLNWHLFEVAGLFLGAFLGAMISRNFKFKFDKSKSIGNTLRFFTAIGGGIMIGFAARLARGCTSGIALSGGAQLALGGWLFVIAMFATGFIAANLMRRLWS